MGGQPLKLFVIASPTRVLSRLHTRPLLQGRTPSPAVPSPAPPAAVGGEGGVRVGRPSCPSRPQWPFCAFGTPPTPPRRCVGAPSAPGNREQRDDGRRGSLSGKYSREGVRLFSVQSEHSDGHNTALHPGGGEEERKRGAGAPESSRNVNREETLKERKRKIQTVEAIEMESAFPPFSRGCGSQQASACSRPAGMRVPSACPPTHPHQALHALRVPACRCASVFIFECVTHSS